MKALKMKCEQSNTPTGFSQKTLYNSLPRRPVTFFLIIAVTVVIFLFIDYTDSNVFSFLIPPSVQTTNGSSVEFNEEHFPINAKENVTTFIPALSLTKLGSLLTTLPSSVRDSMLNSMQTSVPNYVPANISHKLISVSAAPVNNGQCFPTPYVDCYPETIKKLLTNESFGIGLLRKPKWLALETFEFSKCPYSNCKFQGETIDNSTNLVIVYVVGLNDNFKTWPRSPLQLYAAADWESPLHTYAGFLINDKSYWNSAFNLTATYRTDSDIFVPYDRLLYQPLSIEQRPNYYEIAKNKSKSVAWFVSNCRTPSKRHEYVEQMQKVIDIDIYGECGRPCGPSISLCHDNIPIQYRFYLSFENSLCADYVTEKLFKIYSPNTHIIPVVRGALDYDKYIPNNTFINAAHFKGAVDLANFLKKLSDDPTAYSKYLEHKDRYKILSPVGFNLGCQACKFLNTKKITTQVYNMKDWMENKKCHEPTDL